MVRMFELDYFNEVNSFRASEESVNEIINHPSKPLLITTGKDGHIHFWKKDTLEKFRSIAAHNMTIYKLAISPDNKLAASVSRDKSIKLWEVDSFNILKKIDRRMDKGHSHSVNDISWINEKEFFSAGDDRIIRRWKVAE